MEVIDSEVGTGGGGAAGVGQRQGWSGRGGAASGEHAKAVFFARGKMKTLDQIADAEGIAMRLLCDYYVIAM